MSELSKSRMLICATCPELTFLQLCKKCKCSMPLKTHMVSARCPLKKW